MEDIKERQASFRELLRNVGKQLGKADTASIEVFENVPDDERDKGGFKLLEYLQKRGRFTLWKTEPLRDILRNCDRHDLANDHVKNYQMKFSDRDSPRPACHGIPVPLQPPEKSPLLSARSHVHSDETTGQSTTQETLPSAKPPLQLNRSPSGTGVNTSVDESLTTNVSSTTDLGSLGSNSHTSMVELGFTFADSLARHAYDFAAKFSSRECLNTDSTASLNISHCSEPASLPPSLPPASVPVTPQPRHGRSLSLVDPAPLQNSNIYASGNRRCSTESKVENPLLHNLKPKVPNATSSGQLVKSETTSNASSRDLSTQINETKEATIPKMPEENTDDDLSDKSGSAEQVVVPHRSVKAKLGSMLPFRRPISAKRRQSSTSWRIKRDELVSALSKSKEHKAFVCPNQLDINIEQGKNNPRMTLHMYPSGLFQDERNKNVTLLATITHKRIDIVPPDLCIQLFVSVNNDEGCELKSQTVRHNLNMNTIHMFGLLSHNDLLYKLQKDIVELKASVQI